MTDHPAGREPELLTITEAADLLRAPVATLRYWRHLGTGPRSFASAAASCTAPTTSTPGSRNNPPRPSTVDERRRPQACRPPQRLETTLTRGAVVGTVI